MIERPFLTLNQTAKHLRIHRMTAYELVRKGKIPGGKVGGQWRFRREKIDGWISEQMKANTERG